ncbi:MAG TPA: CheR family methyltransferase [Byssovorax sp.]
MSPTAADVDDFRAVLALRLGLQFAPDRAEMLADLLRRRAGAGGVARYLAALRVAPRGDEELRALAPELTVGETYFFRNRAQLDALCDVAIPSVLGASGGAPLRVLSAGCASGEEPYSVAMLLRDRFAGVVDDLASIRAVDLNPVALKKATEGRYSTWSLRETPAATRAVHFRESGGQHVLDASIRRRVAFEERNLALDDPGFFRPCAFDVVLCRNVLMYFEIDAARAIVSRLHASLTPGGYLFLGHAETLRGFADDFTLCHTHETFYYRRGDGRARRGSSPSVPPIASPSPSASTATEASADWMSDIERASARIARLSTPRPPETEAPPPSSASRDRRLDRVMQLVEIERFEEALAALRALPVAELADRRARLVLAVLLTNTGATPDAERVCDELLADDPSHAGARYLAALCRERAGDVDGAIAHDRAATAADPSFAMAHLHLGLLFKRARKPAEARDALRAALALVACERVDRIALFGGGFTRDALGALCRAELDAISR